MKIYCDSSTREACFILEGQEPINFLYPKQVTNNVGEYWAVILALKEAERLKLEQVEVLTDSMLVVNQVNGAWGCRKEHLLPLRDRIRELAQKLQASINWVRREENLAGRALE